MHECTSKQYVLVLSVFEVYISAVTLCVLWITQLCSWVLTEHSAGETRLWKIVALL